MGGSCSCVSKQETDALRMVNQFGTDRRIINITTENDDRVEQVMTRVLLTNPQPHIQFIFGAEPQAFRVLQFVRWLLRQTLERGGVVWGLVNEDELIGVMCLRKPTPNTDISDLGHTRELVIRTKRPVVFKDGAADNEKFQRRLDLVFEQIDKIYETQLESLKQHWVVDFIGVDPTVQDDGGIDAMLNALILISNISRNPIYLTCSGDSVISVLTQKFFRVECSFVVQIKEEDGNEPSAELQSMVRWPDEW